MSLKEDIAVVKEELSSEEQFLSSSIRIERFVKKYKKAFLATLAVVVLSIVGYVGYDYYEKDRVLRANEALAKLIKNPADKEALETLKSKSTKLYDIYAMSVAISKNDEAGLKQSALSKNQVVADLARFQLASIKSDENALRAYASSSDAVLKDLANFLLAQKAIEKKDSKTAGELLAKIPASSNLKEQALYLEHLLIKLNK